MNSSSNHFQAKSLPALIALLLGGAVVSQGCGGDDNPIPTPEATGATAGSSGSGGKGGKGGSGGSSGESEAGNGSGNEGGGGNETSTGGTGATGGTRNTGGTGNTGNRGGTGNGEGGAAASGGEGNEGNEGGGGNEPGVDCSVRGTNGCYRCAPEATDPAPAFPHSANEQFLNHCDDSKGSRFVNAERIPGFTGTDSLPALP